MGFTYFGYGSNMDRASLRAKGVEPIRSAPAALHGHRLVFDVAHFFRHEGGVGNVRPTGRESDVVLGVLHECDDSALPLLDAAEARGYGYERLRLAVRTSDGEIEAWVYVGLPSFLDETCLPTRRYLNILVRGATEAGLDAGYVETLRRHPVFEPELRDGFVPPSAGRVVDEATLRAHPLYTVLDDHVFDMADARTHHDFLRTFFGGRDMTLFHLKRLDDSDGNETLEDVRAGRLTPRQRRYLDTYLHAYAHEYRYVGRFAPGPEADSPDPRRGP
ncbi:MAG: gamma-glutamylcyclotransferase family protein [Polyangiales bacterium]